MLITSNPGITSAPTLTAAWKLVSFPDHFLVNYFRLLLYTMYISGLAGLYLSHSK